MKKVISILIMTSILLTMIPCGSIVAASDTSNARWLGTIRVTNNGTETASYVSVNMSLLISSFIAAGYCNEDASDIAITSNGVDIPFMVGYGDNPWILYIESIGAGQNLDLQLYSGNVTGGEYRYFAGNSGLNMGDSPSLEPGNNATIRVNGAGLYETGTILSKSSDLIFTYDADILKFNAIVPENTLYTQQLTQSTFIGVRSGSYIRNGQRINNFPVSVISRVDFYLKKQGNPTGTAYARVRDADTDAILGLIGTVDVSTIPGEAAFITFNSNVVSTNTKRDIRVTFEYSGGNAGDEIYAYINAAGTAIGEWTSYVAAWSDAGGTTVDCTFKLYTYPSIDATLSPAEYDIEFNVRPTYYELVVNGENTTVNDAISIPDAAGNWTFRGTFFESASVSVGGIEQGRWAWTYPDANTATLTNGTGVATGAPVSLAQGANVINITTAGTFGLSMPYGWMAVATSGTSTVTGSPVTIDSPAIRGATATENITVTGTGNINVALYPAFPDLTGNGHTGYPDFRTESSNPNVSAVLISFVPAEESKANNFTLTSPGDYISSGDITLDLYRELEGFEHIPGAEVPNKLLEESDTPRAVWWFPFLILGICILGMLLYGATTLQSRQGIVSVESNQQGSMLAMMAVMMVILGVVAAVGPLPPLIPILFLVPCAAVIVSMKHYSWG